MGTEVVKVPEFYAKKHHIILKQTNMKGVTFYAQNSTKILWYPPEILTIVPNQIVPLEKLDGLSDQLLKVIFFSLNMNLKLNTVLPHVRYNETIKMAEKLHLFDENNYVFNKFGIKILKNSNKVSF